MLSYADLLPSPSSISPTPKKTYSDLRESRDPTGPVQGGLVPTRGYATVCQRSGWKHCFLAICESVSRTLLTWYLDKYWTYFQQN